MCRLFDDTVELISAFRNTPKRSNKIPSIENDVFPP